MSSNIGQMRVLVIEDDQPIGWFLTKTLRIAGYNVEWLTDRGSLNEFALSHSPDLVLLDLSLSRNDCADLLMETRELFEYASILVLSDRNVVADRLQFLDLGADDFVLKPFSVLELLARCRVLLRRKEQTLGTVERFGNLEMNQLSRSVSYNGAAINLTAKEFQLLKRLILNRGECCSRVDLLNELWPSQSESGTNIVDVHISYLRRKLQLACPGDKFSGSAIQTERGQGYRLRGANTRVAKADPPRSSASSQATRDRCALDDASQVKLTSTISSVVLSGVWTHHTPEAPATLTAA